MGILDIFRRRPAPEPETPAERERREVTNAVRTLQRFGFNPAGPVSRSRSDSLASATMGMGVGSLDKRETIQPRLGSKLDPSGAKLVVSLTVAS
jgi:hypothetical protein